MNTADATIQETLARYDEPFAGNVWRVQGTAVIYHKALERIAVKAGISFDAPTILRAEREEAVILVTGRLGLDDGRILSEWSIGEALIGVNYRVSGKQAAYVWAMAEKRAKDRVILKLIGLHGLVYSEEEADDFRNSAPAQGPARDDVVVPIRGEREEKVGVEQVLILRGLLEQSGRTEEKLCDWKGVGEIYDLTMTQFEEAKNAMEEGIAAQKQRRAQGDGA